MAALTLPARDIIQATPRSRIISADLAGQAFEFRAGQAVFAGLADSSVRRPYSIACSPQQSRRRRSLELLVQIDDHEPPDPHLERAVPGTLLRVDGPFGTFNVDVPIDEKRLLLIAGGTGIAPLRSMLWDTLERQDDVEIGLIYSARNPEEFAYAEELQALAADQHIRLWQTVTRDSTRPWTGIRGRLSESLIVSALPSPETRCVVCGPPSLVADAVQLLKQHGVTTDRILTETYTT